MPVPASGGVDAYGLWLRTRVAVTAAHYPERMDYTIVISGLDGASPAIDHYRASCDADDAVVRLFPISNEQLAKPPPVPHGVNVSADATLCFALCMVFHQPIGHPAPYQDLIGEPLLQPTYMFGMRYAVERTAAPPTQADTSLRTIAVVASGSPLYHVELVGEPLLDGVPTYHLRLTPLLKPKENRLRELWIGLADYLPRRAVAAGNFTEAPLTDVPWTIDFSVVDGVPFLSRESAQQTLYLSHHRVIADAAVAFEDIREPNGSIYDRPLMQPRTAGGALVEPNP